MGSGYLDAWYLDNVVCPVDRSALHADGSFLLCTCGRRYPIVEGVPVMLRGEVPATIGVAQTSLDAAQEAATGQRIDRDPLFLQTLGVSEEERRIAELLYARGSSIDPAFSVLVGATSGIAYRHLIGRAAEYPIPGFRFSEAVAGAILDIGCNWGRWTLAAARAGHPAIGIDPSLGAVLAARRIAQQLNISARFLVGDARYLPFRSASIANVWSYSVLQHFSVPDARTSLGEVGRVLRPGGIAKIQMANTFGLRSVYHIARRKFRAPAAFEVRYWRPSAVRRSFSEIIGPSTIEADCYFGLGLQWSDRGHMKGIGSAAMRGSEMLRRASTYLSPLSRFADSIFCVARKPVAT